MLLKINLLLFSFSLGCVKIENLFGNPVTKPQNKKTRSQISMAKSTSYQLLHHHQWRCSLVWPPCLSLSLSIAHLFNYWTIFSFIHRIDDTVVDFFADLIEVKENLIETWFLVGYGEKQKKRKTKERKKSKHKKLRFQCLLLFFLIWQIIKI